MMSHNSDSAEAHAALHAVRQQQADLIRRSFSPLPAWGWLAAAAGTVLVGVWQDLFRGWAQQAVLFVVVAALLALVWARQPRAVVRHRPAWWLQRFDNRSYWILALPIFVEVLVGEEMSDVFTRMGVPWPNTLGWSVGAAVLLITGPGVRAVLRRRLIARVESGSDDTLHGLPRVLSLLPVYEALERRQWERAETAGRSRDRRESG